VNSTVTRHISTYIAVKIRFYNRFPVYHGTSLLKNLIKKYCFIHINFFKKSNFEFIFSISVLRKSVLFNNKFLPLYISIMKKISVLPEYILFIKTVYVYYIRWLQKVKTSLIINLELILKSIDALLINVILKYSYVHVKNFLHL
jgi:hypothetical protein